MTRKDYLNDPNAPQANNIVVACSAFLQDNHDRILMIRRTDSGLYAIPGGTHELGETLTQTVKREAREETGVDIEVAGLIGIYSNPRHVIEFDDGEVRQEFSICFRARPLSTETTTSSESKEVLWVRPDELDRLTIHPSIRLRIDHGLQRRSEIYYS